MAGWADDPELLATFRAEVEERVASLQAGLLALEAHPSPRQVVASLFRDAHTVKGSARMLGLSEVLAVAHNAEDLLGALRDGRLPVRRDLVDLLLASCDGILGALPGVDDPVPDEHLAALADAMQRATEGEEPIVVPQWLPTSPRTTTRAEDARRRGADSVRVTTAKVYELIDVVGEAELDARRLERASGAIDLIVADTSHWLRALREALVQGDPAEEAAQALVRLLAAHDQMLAASRDLHELADDAQGRLAQVRDGAMGLAMVPVRRVVAGLPRVVRDLAAATGKDVRLVLQGQDVELDKQVLDGVSDALKHLVVNAVDHGCESPAERTAVGKPAHSTVTVTARAAGGTVVIEVADDGSGIDEDRLRADRDRARGAAPRLGAERSGVAQRAVPPGLLDQCRGHRDLRARHRSRRRPQCGRGARRPGRAAYLDRQGHHLRADPAGDARRPALPDRAGGCGDASRCRCRASSSRCR